MALITVRAVVHRPTDIGMAEIRRVPTAMAIRALKHCVVVRIRVARGTNAIRISVVHVEVRVIEGRSSPRCRGVASRAGCRRTP